MFLFHWIAVLPVTIKAEASIVGVIGLILAQEASPLSTGNPALAWLDLGTTVAALALLGYILRLVFSGGLVSKTLIEQVVEHTVKEVLRDERERDR